MQLALNKVNEFIDDEGGAGFVEFVAVTSTVIGLSVATGVAVSEGVKTQSSSIVAALANTNDTAATSWNWDNATDQGEGDTSKNAQTPQATYDAALVVRAEMKAGYNEAKTALVEAQAAKQAANKAVAEARAHYKAATGADRSSAKAALQAAKVNLTVAKAVQATAAAEKKAAGVDLHTAKAAVRTAKAAL